VTHILFTYMNNIPCITQYNGAEKNYILLKYEIRCLNIFTSRSKFICFPYSIYPYRSSTIWIWIWKFARTLTTTITSAVFMELTSRSVILLFSCSRSWTAKFSVVISCKKRRVRRNA